MIILSLGVVLNFGIFLIGVSGVLLVLWCWCSWLCLDYPMDRGLLLGLGHFVCT